MKLKAQMNIEFILGVSILVMIISFIGFSILNNFPPLHSDSIYEMEKAKSFQISHLLIMDEGIWASANISNCSKMGLAGSEPYMLNVSKVMALNNCSVTDYNTLRKILGLGSSADIVINITRLEFTGGIDEKIAECRPMMISLVAPKFLTRRFAVIENTTNYIAKVEITIFGYT